MTRAIVNRCENRIIMVFRLNGNLMIFLEVLVIFYKEFCKLNQYQQDQ